MNLVTLAQVQQALQKDHTYIPVAQTISLSEEEWFPLFKKISALYSFPTLLESGRGGRYSMMAYQPEYRLQGKKDNLCISKVDERGREVQKEQKKGPLLETLRTWMKQRKAPHFDHLPDFCGGLAGYFSYDFARQLERLPLISEDDLQIPDVDLLAFDRLLVYDHRQDQCMVIHYVKANHDKLQESLDDGQTCLHKWVTEIDEHRLHLSVQTEQHVDNIFERESMFTAEEDTLFWEGASFSQEEFEQAVQKTKDYITAGDVFQVNLSLRQWRTMEQDPLQTYETLRQLNPSPYMAYLHFPERQIISGSPEQLVKKKREEISTRPIAGTRPRGMDRTEDLRLAKELVEHEKERAEHVMLVDLERNDLGKVSQFGSVEVDEFMVIEEYSHVMHIVSNVRGQLASGCDMFDVIQAVFPGGTITGAPKIRTMEIIEELEKVHRGLYTGSIGWLDFNGDMELNIVIRTLLIQDDQAYVQAGAGIVMDSIAEQEYEESINKAKALQRALQLTPKREHRKKR